VLFCWPHIIRTHCCFIIFNITIIKTNEVNAGFSLFNLLYFRYLYLYTHKILLIVNPL